MSEPGASGSANTVPTKKQVSPARNAIGIVVLLIVLIVGWFQYSAVMGYNAAVKAMDARTQDENKDLMSAQEAETLMAKPPDDAGTDFAEGTRNFTKKTYTWHGAIKSYTLTAFYTKDKEPRLHHFETDGAKYVPETKPEPGSAGTIKVSGPGRASAPGPERSKSGSRKGAPAAKGSESTADATKSAPPKEADQASAPPKDAAPEKPSESSSDAPKSAPSKDSGSEKAPK
jgi:hypothetical protein